jgi:acyl-CoA reductase-like NAD-dependent aldehyde dehydrogenase
MDAVTVPQPISPVKDFLAKSQKLLIDGKRVDAASGERFKVLDPSKNTVLIRVPKGGKEDINRAVEAERNAFENGPWRKLTVSERGKLIWKLADLIQTQAEEFAKPETLDK